MNYHTQEIQQIKQQIDELLLAKKFPEAIKIIRLHQKKQNKNPEWTRLEGIVYLHQKKLALAKRYFRKALKTDPNYFSAMDNLAFVEQVLGDYNQAKYWLKKSLKFNPLNPETLHQLGIVSNGMNRWDNAEKYFKQTLELFPKHTDCLVNLAVLLKDKGDIEQAIIYLHQALDINPYQPHTYWVLSNLKSYRFNEFEKSIVNKLLQQEIQTEDEVYLLFAQAKFLEDEGNFESSFAALDKANKLKYQNFNRKPVNWFQLYKNITGQFSADFVTNHSNQNESSISPTLIAGMPRSGSTLIEQILSSHSLITGASELNHLTELMERLNKPYPEGLNVFGPKEFLQMGKCYLEMTKEWSAQTVQFTDKMPRNIIYAGALMMALPNLKLIHTRRNAMDVCLSNYKQNFIASNEFTYDLAELVEYFQFQNKLSEFWASRFPNRVLAVDYEELVIEPKQQVSKMLKFLGLEFEPGCLSFHKTKRNIKTASAGQVTQELYTNAVNHYKKYGTSINELSELLKQPFES